MITRTFFTPEELLNNIEPRFVEGPGHTMETFYSKEDVIKLAKAHAKDMAIQVLFEADGGMEEHGKGYIPPAKFNEVLSFITATANAK